MNQLQVGLPADHLCNILVAGFHIDELMAVVVAAAVILYVYGLRVLVDTFYAFVQNRRDDEFLDGDVFVLVLFEPEGQELSSIETCGDDEVQAFAVISGIAVYQLEVDPLPAIIY